MFKADKDRFISSTPRHKSNFVQIKPHIVLLKNLLSLKILSSRTIGNKAWYSISVTHHSKIPCLFGTITHFPSFNIFHTICGPHTCHPVQLFLLLFLFFFFSSVPKLTEPSKKKKKRTEQPTQEKKGKKKSQKLRLSYRSHHF